MEFICHRMPLTIFWSQKGDHICFIDHTNGTRSCPIVNRKTTCICKRGYKGERCGSKVKG